MKRRIKKFEKRRREPETDVLEDKRTADKKRLKVLEKLTAEAQKLGLGY